MADMQKFEELMKNVNELKMQHEELKRQANAKYTEYISARNAAVETIAPFKVGDVVEYKTFVGTFNKKQVTKRMKVRSLNFEYERVTAYGYQVSKAGKTGDNATFGWDRDEFVKVVS